MKWVLVRSSIGSLWVLQRREWEVYAAQANHYGEIPSVLVAESNDRDELVRFRKLTEES